MDLITNGQLFNPLFLSNKTSIKTLNNRIQSTAWLVNTWRCWEVGMPGEGVEALYHPSPPTPCSCISSIWLFLSCIPHYKSVIVSKIFLRSVSCSSKLSNLRRRLYILNRSIYINICFSLKVFYLKRIKNLFPGSVHCKGLEVMTNT